MSRRITDYADASAGWNLINSFGNTTCAVATFLLLYFLIYKKVLSIKASNLFDLMPQYFSDFLQILLNRNNVSLERSLDRSRKPNAFPYLPLQSDVDPASLIIHLFDFTITITSNTDFCKLAGEISRTLSWSSGLVTTFSNMSASMYTVLSSTLISTLHCPFVVDKGFDELLNLIISNLPSPGELAKYIPEPHDAVVDKFNNISNNTLKDIDYSKSLLFNTDAKYSIDFRSIVTDLVVYVVDNDPLVRSPIIIPYDGSYVLPEVPIYPSENVDIDTIEGYRVWLKFYNDLLHLVNEINIILRRMMSEIERDITTVTYGELAPRYRRMASLIVLFSNAWYEAVDASSELFPAFRNIVARNPENASLINNGQLEELPETLEDLIIDTFPDYLSALR